VYRSFLQLNFKCDNWISLQKISLNISSWSDSFESITLTKDLDHTSAVCHHEFLDCFSSLVLICAPPTHTHTHFTDLLIVSVYFFVARILYWKSSLPVSLPTELLMNFLSCSLLCLICGNSPLWNYTHGRKLSSITLLIFSARNNIPASDQACQH